MEPHRRIGPGTFVLFAREAAHKVAAIRLDRLRTSSEAMHDYTEAKSVWVNVDADLPVWYPRH